jgi:predicted transcriptional regulator
MKNLFAKMHVEAQKRALYRVTRDEIARMPRAVALDLGMFPEDAEIIARQAVWG